MHRTPHPLSRRTAIRLASASLAAFAAVVCTAVSTQAAPADGRDGPDGSESFKPDAGTPVRPNHRAIIGML